MCLCTQTCSSQELVYALKHAVHKNCFCTQTCCSQEHEFASCMHLFTVDSSIFPSSFAYINYFKQLIYSDLLLCFQVCFYYLNMFKIYFITNIKVSQ